MPRTHISFSELKIWNECAFKHKLVYIDEVKKFLGNEYTAFGTAIHSVCEKIAVQKTPLDLEKSFKENFLKELKELKNLSVPLRKDLVDQMVKQGGNILPHIYPVLKKTFPSFNVISIEEKLMEPVDDMFFKGVIDLVIQTPDGKYHVIDWKTCSWGWDSKKKNDSMTTYQLTLYKHFFALKHNIDPDKIETHFALLKRTAKSNVVEIFRVTSGKKKTKNSLKLLDKAIYNVKKKNFVKNRLSCTSGYGCEFYKTEHCR